MLRKLLQLSLVVALCAFASLSSAAVTNLTHLNSSVDINDGSQAGVFNWLVDGVDQLTQEWFWYRVGNTAESSIDTLTLSSSATFLGTRGLQLVYQSAGLFDLELVSLLTGGAAGSGQSDLAQNISITNTSGAALDFHFFQYADFDVGGTSSGDTATMVNANTVQVSEPGVVVSETVDTPPASRYEINGFPVTLNSLNDGSPTTLNDDGGPMTGDVTWAWEWDVTIDPGGSFLISKDMSIRPSPVPEPLSMLLVGSSLVGLVAIRRQRG